MKEIDPKISVSQFSRATDLLNQLNSNSTAPDYIFIDINMPMVDGREFARQIGSNEKFSDSRIVMNSTTFRPSDLENFKQQKFECVQKPDRYGQLVEALDKVVNTA